MNYTYILLCQDNSLYTGWTNALLARLEAHSKGRGAKYTKSRLPIRLVHVEAFETKEEAMRREWEIKAMKRDKKLELIKKSLSPSTPKDSLGGETACLGCSHSCSQGCSNNYNLDLSQDELQDSNRVCHQDCCHCSSE